MTDSEQEQVRLLHRSDGELQPEVKPIVLNYRKGRKKKKASSADAGQVRYSRNLEDVQRMEGDFLRVSQKAAKALSKGIDTYERERQQSAKAKKDGAVEDFVYNSAKATSAYVKEASDIPIDMAESLSNSRMRKSLRKRLRRASKMIGVWRI